MNKTLRVCLVEDEDIFHELLSARLSEPDSKVRRFCTFKALTDFGANNNLNEEFDVILVDRFLDREGCDAVIDRLGPKLRNVCSFQKPIGLMSCSSVDQADLKSSGFDFFLKKDQVSASAINIRLKRVVS